MADNLVTPIQPLLVSVRQAQQLLGIGHNKIWQLIGAGEFETVGTSRKRFITVESLRAYVARMPRRPTCVPRDAAKQAEADHPSAP